jgi:hypothetical protein
MKIITRLCLISLFPLALLFGDHLLFTELVLQPSAGEYVKISNPTSVEIDLSDYYISDGADPANGKFYYHLPSGENYWSGSSTDFIARFPSGTKLAAGASLILGLGRASDYSAQYGTNADLALKDDMLSVSQSVNTLGGSPNAKLDNIAESLILFYWDGSSATVKDVDYLIWGNNSFAIDKSSVSGYQNDTPAASQSIMPVHADGEKLIRSSDEGSEVSSGGNGITGHDETSENLAQTWTVVNQQSVKPVIGAVSVVPAAPNSEDSLTFTVTATDEQALAQVTLFSVFAGDTSEATMLSIGNDQFQVKVSPTGSAGPLAFWAVAENQAGLTAKSTVSGVTITEPPVILTIRDVRENFDFYNGKTVTLRGVVTIGAGLLRSDRLSGYFQDNSGRGMNIYSQTLYTQLSRGAEAELTGEIVDFGGVIELELNQAPVILNANAAVPEALEIPVEDILWNPAEYEGTLLRIKGRITSRADNIGGGSNVTIDDGTSPITVRIWNSTGILVDVAGDIVNPSLDSLLQVGNRVNMVAVGGLYSGAAQLLGAYAEDFQPWTDGVEGDGSFSLKTAPYPFVPSAGERIQIIYAYPSDSRVILRVYSLNGQFVSTIADDFQGMAFEKTILWNGRDELGRLMAPGTYLIHLEVTNRSTGEKKAAVAPVVVAGRWN